MVKNKKAFDYYVTTDMKSFDALDVSGWLSTNSSANPSAAQLAREVEFVFIALNRRRDRIGEIRRQWFENSREIARPPLLLADDILARLDYAVQLYGRAYLHKRRVRRGNGLVDALGWLDPAKLIADKNDVDLYEGPQTYKRRGQNSEDIPVDDLLRFERYATGEWELASSAGEATKLAASILRAVNRTADSIFDRNNGLPVMLVKVPAGTDPQEVQEVENRFKRLFNRIRGAGSDQKTIGVEDDISVEALSLRPKDMNMGEIAQDRIRAILAAHDVPESEVFGNAANLATAERDTRVFVRTLVGRLEWLARVIANDDDMMRQGVRVEIFGDEMLVNVEEQAQRFTIFASIFDRLRDPSAADAALLAMSLAGIDLTDEQADMLSKMRAAAQQQRDAEAQARADSSQTETSAQKTPQILGYHIEQGVVERNEARATLGLPPKEEDTTFRDLTVQFDIMRRAREAGYSKEEAARFANLEAPDTSSDPVPPQFMTAQTAQQTNDNDADAQEDEQPDEDTQEQKDARMREYNRLKNFIQKGSHTKRVFASDILTALEIREAIARFASSEEAWSVYP